jgi:hypothetical protein
MDEEIERLVIAVRADTAGFARDVAQMRGELGGGLGEGAERAGRLIEGSLLRAIRGGRTGFDELRTTALRALDDIAAAALRGGVRSLLGGAGPGGLGSALAGLLGAPGRATGGPVTGGRAYTVGERGPELFVPTASGRIEPVVAGAAREVRVAITINAAPGAAPGVLAQSSRQVARAVRAALAEG